MASHTHTQYMGMNIAFFCIYISTKEILDKLISFIDRQVFYERRTPLPLFLGLSKGSAGGLVQDFLNITPL